MSDGEGTAMGQTAEERHADDVRALRERRELICERIRAASRTAGRDASEVSVVAVSKTVGPEEVRKAWAAGYRIFAENRPQELRRKRSALADDAELAHARFDMIGNLQTNKVNLVLELADLIQSVSSVRLAEAISARAERRGAPAAALIEVNVVGEGSKQGFSVEDAVAQAERVVALPGLDVRGTMAMAPAHDADAARRAFAGLHELTGELRRRTGLPLPVISCGMSDDYEIAVEEGSTMVRLGRIVFDPTYNLSGQE